MTKYYQPDFILNFELDIRKTIVSLMFNAINQNDSFKDYIEIESYVHKTSLSKKPTQVDIDLMKLYDQIKFYINKDPQQVIDASNHYRLVKTRKLPPTDKQIMFMKINKITFDIKTNRGQATRAIGRFIDKYKHKHN